jgi:hypothetical protein
MADPTSITQYQTGFAPEIAPYASSLLGQAQAYTDTNQNPYQTYTGERVAQFSPLQQQSYDYASQMQAAPQLQDATAMAGQAGLGALNSQYTYNPSNFDAATAKNMMNPYMQNVVDVQKQQAMRDAAIAQQGQQAQAVNAGAFGGGRDAIMRNQGNAELQRGLQGIQATGLNNAYTQAQNQYNTQYGQNAAQQQFGAGLGMQGLGIANQAAQNLGALGQTQFGQNMGITGLQNQFGLQQQQQAQNLVNTKYEDFQNAQNYPYKQMGFMSDMIRGLPTSQTGATMYQSAPTAIQNLTSLGLGAAGISSLMKAEGGTVNSYANGGAVAFGAGGSSNQLGTMVQSDLESAYEQAVNSGDTPKIRAYRNELEYRDRVKNYKAYAYGGSVMSPEFKQYAVGHIDPRQLPMAQQNAQARGDLETNQFAMQEMANDAALRRGIAPALPAGTDVVRAAGGGILAFAAGGNKGQMTPESLIQQSLDAAKYTSPDTDTRIANINAARPGIAAAYGESEVDPMVREDIARRQANIEGMPSQLNGLTLLRMAAALQKSGVTPSDRYSGMFSAAAEGGEKAMAARNMAESELSKAKLAGAAARQARKDGFTDKAAAFEEQKTAHELAAKKVESSAAVHGAQTLGHIKSTNIAAAARKTDDPFYKNSKLDLQARTLAEKAINDMLKNDIRAANEYRRKGITRDQLIDQKYKQIKSGYLMSNVSTPTLVEDSD